MPLINVADIINDPDLAQKYIVYRNTGTWDAGRFETSEKTLHFLGVITVPSSKEILQLPEGDRVIGIMCFFSNKEIFTTRQNTSTAGTSDQILWKTNRYRIIQVSPLSDYGYYKAFGVRILGN